MKKGTSKLDTLINKKINAQFSSNEYYIKYSVENFRKEIGTIIMSIKSAVVQELVAEEFKGRNAPVEEVSAKTIEFNDKVSKIINNQLKTIIYLEFEG